MLHSSNYFRTHSDHGLITSKRRIEASLFWASIHFSFSLSVFYREIALKHITDEIYVNHI